MAKGQISQYDIGSLSKQAVGVPGEDRSGEIIAQGIMNVGKALKQREDATSTVAATAKFGDFRVDYETQKLELQKQFRDKPGEYPEAVKALGSKLVDQYGQGMSGMIFQKFQSITTNAMAQDADNSVAWANKRDNEIQIGNIMSVKQNIALDAQRVQSPEQLKRVLSGFSSASLDAQKLISPESDAALTTKYAALAKENAMYSQIYAQPSKVLRDLEGGAYQGVLSPEEISTYSGKARTAIQNRAYDDSFRSMYSAQGEILDLQQKVDSQSITPAELIARRQAAWANKDQKDALGNSVVDPEYIKSLDTLISQVLNTERDVKKQIDPVARTGKLTELKNAWDQYLQEKGPGAQPDRNDVVKELELYNKISDAYSQGYITESDRNSQIDIMRTKLNMKASGSPRVRSFNEAIEKAGPSPWWWDKNDVFAYGYGEIKNYVDKAYATLDPTSKLDLTTQMMSQYTKQIKELPDTMISGIKDDQAKRKFAHDTVIGQTSSDGKVVPGILAKFSAYKDAPSGRTLYFGDTTTENGVRKQFMGMNPETGAPRWKYVEGEIITNTKGQRARVLADGKLEVL